MESGIDGDSIALIGVGALGINTLPLIVGKGVKRIKLIDLDIVSQDTVYRSMALSPGDIYLYKVDVVERIVRARYPWVKVVKYPVMLSRSNYMRVLKDVDLIIDASNNLETNLLSSYAAHKMGKNLLIVAAGRGYLTTYLPRGSAPEEGWLERIYESIEGGYGPRELYGAVSHIPSVVGKASKYVIHRGGIVSGVPPTSIPPEPMDHDIYMLGDTLFYTSDERVAIDIERLAREVARTNILFRRSESGIVFEYMDYMMGVTYTGSALILGVDDFEVGVATLRRFIDSIAYKFVV